MEGGIGNFYFYFFFQKPLRASHFWSTLSDLNDELLFSQPLPIPFSSFILGGGGGRI